MFVQVFFLFAINKTHPPNELFSALGAFNCPKVNGYVLGVKDYKLLIDFARRGINHDERTFDCSKKDRRACPSFYRCLKSSQI